MNQVIQDKLPAEAEFKELGLPVFDLRAWKHAEGDEHSALAGQFIKMCQRHGFLYLIGHDIPDMLVSGLFEMSKRFFALEMEEKRGINFLQTGGNSGYVPPNTEVTDKAAKADLKETFAMGRRLPDLDPRLAIAPKLTTPNQWPERVPGFRPMIEGSLEAFCDVAREVLAVTSLGLGGPEHFFDDKVSRPIATMRLNRYPAQDPDDSEAVGIGLHTDSECMSLLAQDDVGGLQVVSPGGVFRDATPLAGALVLIVGEQLTRWTNGALKPTPHRVINKAGRERYSANIFFTTDVDSLVGVIDGILAPGETPRYPAETPGDYVSRRINDVYVHKPANDDAFSALHCE
jgi:isopenicillin N synthase-like dioxygenase